MRLEFNITEDILRAGYIASMENPLIERYIGNTTFDEFKEKLSKFEVWGIVDTLPVGIILFEGNCIHIAVLKEYFGKCGFVIKKALKLALEKYGGLIGLVDIDDKRAQDFNERLGFKRLGMTHTMFIYYRG